MEDPRIGQVLEDRYSIEERIASGGMGVVYRGQRLGLGKTVAIKFLHATAAGVPGRRRRFQREAAVMSRLVHPNLSSIIDFGTFDSVPYLVMEYYPGRSLRELLADEHVSPSRAVHIMRQVLAGLESLHQSGVVHRDLKPANVLLVGNPGEDLVKILDFGVAKLLETQGLTEVSDPAGEVKGTPEYMSPEQAMGETIDRRADIYSVGVMLYEMATGSRPFEGEGGFAVLRMHVEDEPKPPRELTDDISAGLEAVIMQALEKDPSKRWQTAAEMSSVLLRLPEGPRVEAEAPTKKKPRSASTSVAPPTRPATPLARIRLREEEPAPPRPARRRLARVLIVVLALAALGALGLWIASEQGWIELDWRSWLP